MTYLVERLAELRKHLDHLGELQPRVSTPRDLESDLSLHNDVLFSLLTVAQLVIDVAGELSARKGLPFEDYTTAVKNLARLQGFSEQLVEELEPLPGFRNVLIHKYVGVDYDFVIRALGRLEPIEEFIRIVGARLKER